MFQLDQITGAKILLLIYPTSPSCGYQIQQYSTPQAATDNPVMFDRYIDSALHDISERLPLLKVRLVSEFQVVGRGRSRSRAHGLVAAVVLVSVPRELNNREHNHEGVASHYSPGWLALQFSL